MKALILAAGLGSRLKHLTLDNPKALVPINSKPILQYQIDNLLDCGIKDIGIVLGCHGQNIINFVKNTYPELEIQYFWNHEFDTSNSSYSFWQAKEWVKDTTYLHFNCDILFSSTLLKKIIQDEHENVIAIRTDYPLGNKMENVSLQKNKITRMCIDNFPEAVGKAFGVAKLGTGSTEELTNLIKTYIDSGDKNQNYYGMIRQAISAQDYYAVDARDDILLEVNTLDDKKTAEGILKKRGSE